MNYVYMDAADAWVAVRAHHEAAGNPYKMLSPRDERVRADADTVFAPDPMTAALWEAEGVTLFNADVLAAEGVH